MNASVDLEVATIDFKGWSIATDMPYSEAAGERPLPACCDRL